MAAKGRTKDNSLSKLGSRLISTMLKNERLAEKELEAKMKAIKVSERKSMVKICETSLEMKYDYRRKRNTQIMEDQNGDDVFSAGLPLGQEKVARSPSFSRRGSYAPATTKQTEEEDKPPAACPNQETSAEVHANPTIFINNERKDADSAPGSRRSSVGSVSSDVPSPCATPPNELADDHDEEHVKKLKVFSQSPQAHRRRTAPDLADLSPKLLIQLAKSSAEVKRRGSTHDVAATVAGEETSESAPSPLTKRRGSATVEGLRAKSEHSNSQHSDVHEKTENSQSLENNHSPSMRRRGSASVGKSNDSPSLHRRRGSASITNVKTSLSLEANEALLRDKISDHASVSPLLKHPSPLLGRRGSGAASTLRTPISPQGGSSCDKLPDLDGALHAKKPALPALRRSLSPARSISSMSRPSSARSLSSLSAGSPEDHHDVFDFDLPRRQPRPGSARSCLSSGSHLSLDSLGSRRGSDLSQIDFSSLSPTSPLRKAMEDPKATLNPTSVSPRVLRRHSGNVEQLQDRVDDFLKTLSAKSS